MMSLRAFLPQLADIFGSTTEALYERQRALVRLELLKPLKGRGPGSGVQLSADYVAVIIIALGVTDNLSDTDERVRRLCNAKPFSRATCPFTGEDTFRKALGTILGSTEKARYLINRNDPSARIGYLKGRKTKTFWSAFDPPRETIGEWPPITTTSMINKRAIQRTAESLQNLLNPPTDTEPKRSE